jgi:hypothetical protein
VYHNQRDLVWKSVQKPITDALNLSVWCDSDWASDKLDRKSITGYVVYLNDCMLDWLSRKQHHVATSSSDAEFYALCDTVKDVIFLAQLLQEMGLTVTMPVTVNLDNQGAKCMAENNLNNDRSKHIDIKFRFITDWIERGLVTLRYVPSEENRADIMTKALPPVDFKSKLKLSL